MIRADIVGMQLERLSGIVPVAQVRRDVEQYDEVVLILEGYYLKEEHTHMLIVALCCRGPR